MPLTITSLMEVFPAGTNIILTSKHILSPDQPARRSDALQSGDSICNCIKPAPGDTAQHAASYILVIMEHTVQSCVYPENDEPPLRAGQQQGPQLRSHLPWERSAEVPHARQPAVGVNNGGATPAVPDPLASRSWWKMTWGAG